MTWILAIFVLYLIIGIVFASFWAGRLNKKGGYEFHKGDIPFWGMIAIFWFVIVVIVVNINAPRYIGMAVKWSRDICDGSKKTNSGEA